MLLGCILQTTNSTQVKIVKLLYFYSFDMTVVNLNLFAKSSMLLIKVSEKKHNLHTQSQLFIKVSECKSRAIRH